MSGDNIADDFLRSITNYNWTDVEKSGHGYQSLNDCILYEGKWIAHGTREYIKEKAKELEPLAGGFISHFKYSLSKDDSSLVAYCNVVARKDARRVLESHGSDLKWDTNVNSLLRYLRNPSYVCLMSGMNPERLIELGDLVGMDMRPQVDAFCKFRDDMLTSIQTKLKEAEISGNKTSIDH